MIDRLVVPLTRKLSRAIREDEISASAACASFLKLVDARHRLDELQS